MEKPQGGPESWDSIPRWLHGHRFDAARFDWWPTLPPSAKTFAGCRHRRPLVDLCPLLEPGSNWTDASQTVLNGRVRVRTCFWDAGSRTDSNGVDPVRLRSSR